jgi:drug/metabolite transporter (DMT)-like permease
MLAIALALGSSVLWGLADFLGGLKSRSLPVPVVLAVMYASSLTAMTIFVGARGHGPPELEAVLAGLGAGLFGIAGLMAFYRALAIGTMSIVAPIASTGVALPVLVGLATGDEPGLLRSLGLAAAVAGVVLASREADGGAADRGVQRQSILLAVVAGVGFGLYFTLAEISSRGDVAWALLLSRTAATPFVLTFALLALRRGGRRLGLRELAIVAGFGLIDLAANVLYNVSTTLGDLSTVAVASSLYPVTTVLLAASLLGERVRGIQRTGVVIALCAVVMIAAGT